MTVSIHQFRSNLNDERREGRISYAAEFYLSRHPLLDANDALWFFDEAERIDYFRKFRTARKEARKRARREFYSTLVVTIKQVFEEKPDSEVDVEEFYRLIELSEHEVDRLDSDSTALRMSLGDRVKPRLHSFDRWKISRRQTIASSLYAEGIGSMDELLTAFLNYNLETSSKRDVVYEFLYRVVGLEDEDARLIENKLIKYMLKIDDVLSEEEE